MKCPNCGNEVNEGYDYCPRCGTRAKVSHPALKEQIEETRHKERFNWICVIIGVIVAVFGGIIGIVPTATRRSGDYIITYHPYADTAIAILILGGILIALGYGLAIWYARKRKKLLRQLNNIER